MKQELLQLFKEAVEKGAKYVWVEVQMEDYPKNELIVNHITNAEAKAAYYDKAYNDNLELNFNAGIKIVNFGYQENDVIEISLCEVE